MQKPMRCDTELTRFRHPDHPRPRTRRQFLAQGFLTGAATILSPSLFGLLRSPDARAQALTCNIAAGAGRIPFVCFDLGGGASIPGSNVLVGGAGGQLDPLGESGYVKLGLPLDLFPTDPLMVNTELGLAFHADSAFLRGILATTSAATRANVNGCVICARSENDTGNNPHNPMYGINAAGANGDLVALVGTRSSESGGRSAAPQSMVDPAVRPTKVDRPADVTGLVDTGKLVELLDADDAAAVMGAVERISELKLQKMTEAAIVEDLIRCSYIESTDKVASFGDPSLLDPNNDADIAAILAGAGLSIDQSEFRKTASVMKLVVNGFAGAGTIEFGGYDYHDSTRTTGERKDEIAGQAMGSVLEYAARRGQQLMLYVFSDGSVASDGTPDAGAGGKLIWKSDNSGTAGVFILVYDPAGRPQLTAPARQQIGYFRSSGSVETGATRVSNNVEQLAQSIVLNYLALHDEVGELGTVLPNHGLGNATQIDELVAFQPIRSST
jgi:hypothetical protein